MIQTNTLRFIVLKAIYASFLFDRYTIFSKKKFWSEWGHVIPRLKDLDEAERPNHFWKFLDH